MWININKLEDYELHPFKEIRPYWGYYTYAEYFAPYMKAWILFEHLVESNVGVHVNNVFSKFCKKVPKRFQTKFWEWIYDKEYLDTNYYIKKPKKIRRYNENHFKSPQDKYEYVDVKRERIREYKRELKNKQYSFDPGLSLDKSEITALQLFKEVRESYRKTFFELECDKGLITLRYTKKIIKIKVSNKTVFKGIIKDKDKLINILNEIRHENYRI